MRYMLPAILCLLIFSTSAQADEASEVRERLKEKIDSVTVLLKDKTLDKALRNNQIIDIVTPLFDYQAMAKLSLGKKYWPDLSQEKRQAFSELFITRLQESYLSKLDIYSDEEVVFGEPQKSGNKLQLPSTLVSKQNRIEMLYKLYRSASGWKIYDVEIGGVSIIQTYRSQFDEVLDAGNIDDLLAKLKTDGQFENPASGSGKAQSEL